MSPTVTIQHRQFDAAIFDLDGVRGFLAARGIKLPEGSEHEPPEAETIRALAERKAHLLRHELQKGIKPEDGAVALLNKLRQAGIRIAVASSSKNCALVLQAPGLDCLVDARTDGIDAEALGLPGKPDPALFLEAAWRLGVRPPRAILFEDALAGVEASRRGGFRYVVGIDHDQQQEALRRHGADIVIRSLREVEVTSP